jgi:hypothetical protein
MACAAEKTTDVVRRCDLSAICLHRKTNIYVTYSAGCIGTVQPMVESHRSKPYAGGIIVNNDSTIEVWSNPLLLDTVFCLN